MICHLSHTTGNAEMPIQKMIYDSDETVSLAANTSLYQFNNVEKSVPLLEEALTDPKISERPFIQKVREQFEKVKDVKLKLR